jgi:hypothetical protein
MLEQPLLPSMNPSASGVPDPTPSAPRPSWARKFFLMAVGILLLYLVAA